mgnify:CR=1 FL=1
MNRKQIRTGIVKDEIYLAHRPVQGHPESHRRLDAVYQMLDNPEMRSQFVEISSRPARREELLWTHSPEHIERIAATAGHPSQALTADTFTSADSYHAARMAAGGLFEAITGVVDGIVDNAFVLARPPGHHAEKSRAMGFCLFNNVALGAAFARKALGLKRVLIVDWDVHHGNGVQHIFEQDPSVFYFSIHQYPLFPGTGVFTETGRGPGEGYTINIPLSRGYGDGEYLLFFDKILWPVAQMFRPELILVSAGFDTHRKDPIGGMRMTANGFAALTRSLMELAETCCHGRLVMTLEGGYHLEALKQSVKAVLREMADQTYTSPTGVLARANLKKAGPAIFRSIKVNGIYWENLKSS